MRAHTHVYKCTHKLVLTNKINKMPPFLSLRKLNELLDQFCTWLWQTGSLFVEAPQPGPVDTRLSRMSMVSAKGMDLPLGAHNSSGDENPTLGSC